METACALQTHTSSGRFKTLLYQKVLSNWQLDEVKLLDFIDDCTVLHPQLF